MSVPAAVGEMHVDSDEHLPSTKLALTEVPQQRDLERFAGLSGRFLDTGVVTIALLQTFAIDFAPAAPSRLADHLGEHWGLGYV